MPDSLRYLRAALAAFGLLGCAVALVATGLFELFNWSGPDQSDTAGLDHYVEISIAWVVGIAILGVSQAYQRRPDGRRRSVQWVIWCDLGLLLAFLWPAQIMIAACAFAIHARSRAWRVRGGVALAGVGVLLAGAWWVVTGYEAEQPWLPAHANSADSAVVGTWTGTDGGQIELHADGEFRSSNLPYLGPNGPWTPQFTNTTGEWKLGRDGEWPYETLWLTAASGAPTDSLELDVFGGPTAATLCVTLDHVERCNDGFHRG
ncbi:hypothetical protein P3T36_005430 [Kitasatospora sp. MAP12-15]|uniref:hypothetical protein n=1 Tax=unclassified Kitasatospora TaxID=2633591 RepID=UPI0024739372|nr:hypothetical protein [Kitasatospora sp. MAP12-44]MDH6109769.1 hypothetical protein [Kitasatospora sp. MAP12-44]